MNSLKSFLVWQRPMTQKQLLAWLFLFFTLIASVQYFQYYIFYNSSYPFPYVANLTNSYGTFYIYWLFLPLIFKVSQHTFQGKHQLFRTVLAHLFTALSVAAIHIFIMHLLGWLRIYHWTTDPFWGTYRFLVSKWLHIELMAYIGIVFAWRGLVYKAPSNTHDITRYLSQIKIKEGGIVSFVPVNEVRWIEAYDNYIKVWVKDRFHLVRMPLKEIANQLDPRSFKRIHRSTLVSIREVTGIKQGGGQYEVLLRDDTRLKLSRTFKKDLEVALQV